MELYDITATTTLKRLFRVKPLGRNCMSNYPPESCQPVWGPRHARGIAPGVASDHIRLDKAGGLTEALALAAVAKRRGLRIMAGGVIGTSPGITPALLVARLAEIVDLGGPLHLASDRVPGLRYDGSTIYPPNQNSWGQPT
jgi:L-alanine-DL-glutamate epimerase-like enolase superfamily enzyme